MSKNNETPTNAAPLEVDDSVEIDAGANYDAYNPLWIEDPDPSKRYFFAATDDKSRPDSVESCKRLGYKVSTKKHGSVDCVLMECDQAAFDAREKRRIANQAKLTRAAYAPSGIPERDRVVEEDHGKVRKVK